MKIVDIFTPYLYSFVYKKEDEDVYDENEYNRLMELWTDVEYLREYAKINGVEDINKFVRQRLNDAENIQDLLEEITQNKQPLDYYFHPLFDDETGIKILALRKGKASKWDGLRLYAIKIDSNCFVITGGAIKMSQTMQDHPDTNKELKKIKEAKAYLKENGIVDEDGFFEFIDEFE